MTSVEALSSALKSKLKLQHLFIEDVSGCGCGQKVILFVCSEDFVGVPLIKRHKLVQEILKDEIEKLHAITLKLWTPEQWEGKKGEIPAGLEELV